MNSPLAVLQLNAPLPPLPQFGALVLIKKEPDLDCNHFRTMVQNLLSLKPNTSQSDFYILTGSLPSFCGNVCVCLSLHPSGWAHSLCNLQNAISKTQYAILLVLCYTHLLERPILHVSVREAIKKLP